MVEQLYNFEEMAAKVTAVLREQFPTDTIVANRGYNGRVQLKLVSAYFDGKSEAEKQDIIWDLLRDRLKGDAEAVSLAIVYGTDEL